MGGGSDIMIIQEQINYIQRRVIVHSYIYYECDYTIISDKDYDALTKKLVEYKSNYPELWKNSEYYKQFGDDYNGATGFTLYHDLDDHQKEIIRAIARYGMKHY
jgi:NAD-dependent DNA ligase